MFGQNETQAIHFSGRLSRSNSLSDNDEQPPAKKIKIEKEDTPPTRRSVRQSSAKAKASTNRPSPELYNVPEVPAAAVQPKQEFKPEPGDQLQFLQLQQQHPRRLQQNANAPGPVNPNRALTPELEGRINRLVTTYAYAENKNDIAEIDELRDEILARISVRDPMGIKTAIENAVPRPPDNDPSGKNPERRYRTTKQSWVNRLSRPAGLRLGRTKPR